jgi:hypothetical protein
MWFANVRFGKYVGNTLSQIILKDPDYFFWGTNRGIFTTPWAQEAARLSRRARAIKVPRAKPWSWQFVHVIGPDGAYDHFDIVSKGWKSFGASNRHIVADHLDLSFVWRRAPHDKAGNRRLLRSFRSHFLPGERLTRDWAEDFFSNIKNFAV